MRLRLQPLEKKQLSCLKCGRTLWTDAGHRMCRECRRRNGEVYNTPVYTCSGGDAGALPSPQ